MSAEIENNNLGGAYLSTFLLTLTNPVTILSFVAIFAGLGLVGIDSDIGYTSTISLVTGVFIGSGVWWLTLSGLVSLFRDRFNAKMLVWVNRSAGVILTMYGIFALISAYRMSA